MFVFIGFILTTLKLWNKLLFSDNEVLLLRCNRKLTRILIVVTEMNHKASFEEILLWCKIVSSTLLLWWIKPKHLTVLGFFLSDTQKILTESEKIC